MKVKVKKFACLVLLALSASVADAKPVIAVLNFELRDLTLLPGSQAEIERTASIRALMEAALRKHGCEIADIPPNEQQKANAGFGYLFEHHDVAAQLGTRFHADYLVIGRLHKPSYLFAYIMAHLVDTKNQKLIGDFLIEVKGTDAKLTEKGAKGLSGKISEKIDCRGIE